MDGEPRSFRVFIPPLIVQLLDREREKGAPLEEAEVLAVVDESGSTEMIEPHARMLEEKRGYRDLDPDDCWADWLAFRAEVDAAAAGAGGTTDDE